MVADLKMSCWTLRQTLPGELVSVNDTPELWRGFVCEEGVAFLLSFRQTLILWLLTLGHSGVDDVSVVWNVLGR